MNGLLATAPPPAGFPAAPLRSAAGELISSITLQAPLLDASSACLALRCTERRLMEWVVSGDLEWSFDLRRAGARRSCLRILTESIVRLNQRKRSLTPSERTVQQSRPMGRVFDLLFPQRRTFLLSTELTWVWACSSSHVHNLAQDGLLRVVEKDYQPREPAQICRETALEFMQSRRII